MISRGDTTGVFQLESSGFREILKKLKPDCLRRHRRRGGALPAGPARTRHGRRLHRPQARPQKIEYPHPWLEPVLKDTYGVIVYQEQVMQIAQVLGGYSLGGADLLRRAMGKKSKEVMDKEKAGFVDGAKGKGVDEKIADSVFELMAFFAGYGFNRSHSAAYGWVTYQTAYLKHHYPHEFMAGLMSCDADNIDNIVKFIAEARAMGLTVERPDVDESAADFTVTPRPGALGDKVIRFGLGAVKGVGSTAVDAVLDARKDGGGFTSIYDFGRRVDTQRCNRRVIEQLIKSGAFDGPIAGGRHRATILAALDGALEQGASEQRDRKSGQTSLFGLIAAPAPTPGAAAQGETYPAVEPWPAKQLLAFEKEALGFYISGHPLDRYRDDLARYATATTSDFIEGAALGRRGRGGRRGRAVPRDDHQEG
jgi:DNA polymerase-3 subunit alpha